MSDMPPSQGCGCALNPLYVCLPMRSTLHLLHPILTLLPFRAHFQSSADLKLGENIVNFGVIGYGYWGPNIVRNLTSLEDSQVLAIAEMSPSARKRAQTAYP